MPKQTETTDVWLVMSHNPETKALSVKAAALTEDTARDIARSLVGCGEYISLLYMEITP